MAADAGTARTQILEKMVRDDVMIYLFNVPNNTAAFPTTPPLDVKPTAATILSLQSPAIKTIPSGLCFTICQLDPLKWTIPSGPIPYILLHLLPLTVVKKYPVEVACRQLFFSFIQISAPLA